MRRWIRTFSEVVVLYFLHGMALAMWFVPLSTVLEAHGLGAIRPHAFAASALAAFVSPLAFGAMADRHVGPVRVLRWLGVATSLAMALASTAIGQGWSPWVVLGCIQVHALCSSPTWSISSAIVFSRLDSAKRQFGPLRAVATVGWMAGCWTVSGLGADASVASGYGGAVVWLLLAGWTWFLEETPPTRSAEPLTLSQRFGLDALGLLKVHDHRVVFITAALFSVAIAAFYPFTPPQLKELGLTHTSAWMSIGQVTEVIAMVGLYGVLAQWRLKWVFGAGVAFGLVRYLLCATNQKLAVLLGIMLHGFAFSLFFITMQVYLEENVGTEWRARAQALFTLVTSGVGNLVGYLGSGWWFAVCTTTAAGVQWGAFWGGLSVLVAAVLVYFILAYHGDHKVGSTRSATCPTGDAG